MTTIKSIKSKLMKASILLGVSAFTNSTMADEKLQGWNALYHASLNQVKTDVLIEKFDHQCTHRIKMKNTQGITREKVFTMANPEYTNLGGYRYEYATDDFMSTAFDIPNELAPKVQSIIIEMRKLKAGGYASLAPAIKLTSKDAPLLIEKTLKSGSEFSFEQDCSKAKTNQERNRVGK